MYCCTIYNGKHAFMSFVVHCTTDNLAYLPERLYFTFDDSPCRYFPVGNMDLKRVWSHLRPVILDRLNIVDMIEVNQGKQVTG